jgi:prefoldin subunit 5
MASSGSAREVLAELERGRAMAERERAELAEKRKDFEEAGRILAEFETTAGQPRNVFVPMFGQAALVQAVIEDTSRVLVWLGADLFVWCAPDKARELLRVRAEKVSRTVEEITARLERLTMGADGLREIATEEATMAEEGIVEIREPIDLVAAPPASAPVTASATAPSGTGDEANEFLDEMARAEEQWSMERETREDRGEDVSDSEEEAAASKAIAKWKERAEESKAAATTPSASMKPMTKLETAQPTAKEGTPMPTSKAKVPTPMFAPRIPSQP